jgi:hypothetical protein
VAEGDSDTTTRIGGREGWFCFQPGVLNDTGTGWRCGCGHAITSEHVPADRSHKDVCAWPAKCPWPFLIESGAAGPAPRSATAAAWR